MTVTASYAALAGLYIADAAPTVTDDVEHGYTKNSLWFNTTTGGLYLLYTDAVGAADWRNVVTTTQYPNTTSAPKVTATAGDPTVNDDVDLGYASGDIWVNTSDAGVFVCVTAADGAANWDELGKAV